jgi:hypothetical protein
MVLIAASKDFKKIKDEIEKIHKRGKLIVVGDLIKDKTKDKKDPSKDKGHEPGEPDDDDNSNLTREERKKKYFERADIVEALNIAADLAIELKAPTMKLGAKAAGKSEAATN